MRVIGTLIFDRAQVTSRLNYSRPRWGGQSHPLTSAAGQAIVIVKYGADNDQPERKDALLVLNDQGGV